MIKQLKNLIKNNNKIIKAIDDGKSIDLKKSVRASFISSNILAEALIEFMDDFDEYSEPITRKSSDSASVNKLKDIFGMFDGDKNE